MNSLSQKPSSRFQANIVLDPGESGPIIQYSNLENMKGHVDLTVTEDTPIGDILISFDGKTATVVQNGVNNRGPASGRTTGEHPFLQLQQRVDVLGLFGNEDCVARPLQTYTLPFTFTIPERLLPHACTHDVDEPNVKEAHLHLPPSWGGQADDSDQSTFSPIRVAYSVSVEIMYQITQQPTQNAAVARFRRILPILLVPGSPLDTSVMQSKFCVAPRTEHSLGKFGKSNKSGAIVIESSKAARIHLPRLRTSRTHSNVTTTVDLNIRYDAPAGASENPPPQLIGVEAVLESHAFYASKPYQSFPDTPVLESRLKNSASPFRSFSSTKIKTFTLRFGDNVNWVKHDPHITAQAETSSPPSYSMASPSTTHSPSSAFYTTTVSMPLSLSADDHNKMSKEGGIAPTFHSCLVSRVYQISITANFRTKQPTSRGSFSGSNSSSPSLILQVPLLVTTEGSPSVPQTSEQYENSLEREIDQEFFSQPAVSGHAEASPGAASEMPPAFVERHADPELPPALRIRSNPETEASALPDYNSSAPVSRRASQPIQTRYEVPPQEWMHVGKIFSWTYKKIDQRLEKRRNSRST